MPFAAPERTINRGLRASLAFGIACSPRCNTVRWTCTAVGSLIADCPRQDCHTDRSDIGSLQRSYCRAMNKALEASGLLLNISAVERETGLSKDVLRMWERRYGFPKPDRDENGERQYTPADDREAARHQAPDGRRHAPRQADAAVARRAERAGGRSRGAAQRASSRRRSSATCSRCCSRTTRPACSTRSRTC